MRAPCDMDGMPQASAGRYGSEVMKRLKDRFGAE